MDAALELFGFHFSFLIIGLLLVRLVRIPLSRFLGLYALLVAAKALLGQMMVPETGWLPVLIVGAVGALVLVLAAGRFGNSFSSEGYQAVLVGVGLAPWYLGWAESGLFLFIVLITLTVVTEVKTRRAFSSIGSNRMKISVAKKRLTEEEFATLKKRGSTILAVPLAVGSVLSAIALLFA